MKHLLSFLFIVLFATSCHNAAESVIEKQIKEAEAAKKTSDSILQEFKKVNEGLDKAMDSLDKVHDSLLRQRDTTAGVGAIRTVPRTP